MSKFRCVIKSPGYLEKFPVSTSSAIRIAYQHGKQVSGETIEIYNNFGELVSKAEYEEMLKDYSQITVRIPRRRKHD